MNSDELQNMKNSNEYEQSSQESSSSECSIFLEEDEENKSEKIGLLRKNISKIPSSRTKKYCNIPNELRLKLIEAVETQGEKIKHAAKHLSINYSSAKSIYQVYKREGRSSKKSFKKRHHKQDRLSSFNMESYVKNENNGLSTNKIPQSTNSNTAIDLTPLASIESRPNQPEKTQDAKPPKVIEDMQSLKNSSAMSTTSGDSSSDGKPERQAKGQNMSNLFSKGSLLGNPMVAWQQSLPALISNSQNVAFSANGMSNPSFKVPEVNAQVQLVPNQQTGFNNMLIPVYPSGYSSQGQSNFQVQNQVFTQSTPNFNIGNNISLTNLSQTSKLNSNIPDGYQVPAPYMLAPYINVANSSGSIQSVNSYPMMQQAVVYVVSNPNQNMVQFNQNQMQFTQSQYPGALGLLQSSQLQAANNQKILSFPQNAQMQVPIQPVQMVQQQSQQNAYMMQQATLQQKQQEMIHERNRLLRQMQDEMEKIKINMPKKEYEKLMRGESPMELERVSQETVAPKKAAHL